VYLAHISLSNFRNYSRLELDLQEGITLLQGANAQGKTNFLEAIAYLATARSLLSTAERELVNWLAWDEPLPFARLVGDLVRDGRRLRIEITLLPSENTGNGDAPRMRKEVRVNGVSRRAIDLVGQMPVVMFLPQDIDLIAGAPGVRRRYLDMALCQMQGDYCRALSGYNKVLQQRNALLKQLRERGGGTEQLAFWDGQMAQLGALVVARRARFVSDLEMEGNRRQQALTGGLERLQARYLSSLDQELDDGVDEEVGRDDTIGRPGEEQRLEQVFRRVLARGRRRDLAAGMSLVGPHRDDVQFLAQGRDLRTYGSRGQQRTAALAAKLAEVTVMQQALGVPPLVLLDDVMSELDSHRRSYLLDALSGVRQAVITTTDWTDFSEAFRGAARCLHVSGGRLMEEPGADPQGEQASS
jgi:DNA replication and repair protein RecF